MQSEYCPSTAGHSVTSAFHHVDMSCRLATRGLTPAKEGSYFLKKYAKNSRFLSYPGPRGFLSSFFSSEKALSIEKDEKVFI